MALLETRLKHKSYFIELCGSGPWKQNLKFHKWLCLSRLRQKKNHRTLFFFLAQANHAPKKVARFKASAAALLGRHCRKKFEIASKLQKLLHRSSKFAILHSSCHLLSPLLKDIHKIIRINLLLAVSYFTMLNLPGFFL